MTLPITKAMQRHVLRGEPVGSRVTCDPVPETGDEDYLILTDFRRAFHDAALHDGFETTSEYGGDESLFTSYRKGSVNLIVTTKEGFYRLFLVASGLAKRFNLLAKADRVALFQGVLYGKGPGL